MLNIEAKYEQLKLMLSVEGYNISLFEDDLTGEYFFIDTEDPAYSLSVFQEEDKLQILLQERVVGGWSTVEEKYYKTVKGALNKIMKLLN